MILQEFGIKKLFNKVFPSLIFPSDINNTSKYFEGNIEYLNLSDIGVKEIEDFFINYNEFDLEILSAIMSISSYKKISSFFEEKINNYILQHITSIFLQLDNVHFDRNDFDKVNVQIYKAIKDTKKIDSSLLDNICKLAAQRKDLFKHYRYWGLYNLFTHLCTKYHEKFSNWYLNTKKEVIKIVFTYIVLNDYNIFEYATPELSKSQIVFIRAISKIIEYNLNANWLGHPYFKKTFIDLDLDDEENIICILYYYEYKSIEEIKKEEFQKVSPLSKFLTKEVLEQFLNKIINKRLLVSFILNIEDNIRREELLNILCININKAMNEDKLILLDRYLNDLDAYSIAINKSSRKKNYILDLENEFKRICTFMNKPYSYYRETEIWQNNIKILVSYLVVLTAVEDYNIDKLFRLYTNTKKQFLHYQEKEIEAIINEIIKKN